MPSSDLRNRLCPFTPVPVVYLNLRLGLGAEITVRPPARLAAEAGRPNLDGGGQGGGGDGRSAGLLLGRPSRLLLIRR